MNSIWIVYFHNEVVGVFSTEQRAKINLEALNNAEGPGTATMKEYNVNEI